MDAKEKDQILESLFKDNPGAEVPPEVEIRLGRHLATLRERMEAPRGEERFARVQGWGLALRYATPAVAVILIGFIAYLIMAGGGSSRAFADVVERLREARTLTYTMTSRMEGTPLAKIPMEYAFKEPHYIRVSAPMGTYSVINMAEKKGLTVMTPQKQYIEMDLSDASPEQFQVSDVVYEMRSLPERADEVLGEEEINGRIVQGFRVTDMGMDKTLWVDVETGDLVQMEGEFVNAPGMYVVIENIRFGIEYDDSFFSLEPPSGFTPLKVEYDSSLPGEQDLINVLDFFTSHHVDGLFPESMNPGKISASLMDLMKSGMFREPDTEGMTPEEKEQASLETTNKLTRGFMFVMQLGPQNDWHYVGKDVELGAADTPVFWYKPDGSETYRVIFADLDVRDVAPEDLPPVPAE
jgi:outer membrane lipoprotein-sorting protein